MASRFGNLLENCSLGGVFFAFSGCIYFAFSGCICFVFFCIFNYFVFSNDYLAWNVLILLLSSNSNEGRTH